MKLFKRLAAMAMMAALCITMTTPMSADAAQSVATGCASGYHFLGKRRNPDYHSFISALLSRNFEIDSLFF